MIPDGTRVMYTGNGMMLSPHRLGKSGTVLSSYSRWSHTFNSEAQVCKVKWDASTAPQSVFAFNVDVIELNPTWEI
jgi:hypothetical protein